MLAKSTAPDRFGSCKKRHRGARNRPDVAYKPATQRLYEDAKKNSNGEVSVTPHIFKEAPSQVSFQIRLRNLQK